MVSESAARFGSHDHLVGILSTPPRELKSSTGVILVNSGLVYRIGPHRLHVRMARRLAAQGHACLRVDLSGIGDSISEEAGGGAEQWIRDVQDGVAFLIERAGVKSVTLFGICAGAVRAYEAALVTPDVTGVIMLDCYMYRTWKTRLHYYAERVRAGVDWGQVLRSRLTRKAGKSKAPSAFQNGGGLSAARIEKHSFAEGLRSLDRRGAWVAQIMSGDFPDLYSYADQFKEGFSRYGLGPAMTAHYFPEANHTFSTSAMQEGLIDFVAATVDARSGITAG